MGLRWPGRDVNQSRPCTSEVKNEWSCTSAPYPPYLFTALYISADESIAFTASAVMLLHMWTVRNRSGVNAACRFGPNTNQRGFRGL